MYNPNFNSPEFEGIKNAAGLNRFILSVKQWVEKTNSRGIASCVLTASPSTRCKCWNKMTTEIY